MRPICQRRGTSPGNPGWSCTNWLNAYHDQGPGFDEPRIVEAYEAYFGVDGFYPFNRAELMTVKPAVYEWLLSIWGPIAGPRAKSHSGSAVDPRLHSGRT
jgi:hypothetical protein